MMRGLGDVPPLMSRSKMNTVGKLDLVLLYEYHEAYSLLFAARERGTWSFFICTSEMDSFGKLPLHHYGRFQTNSNTRHN